jgi:hypothetical protein
MYSADSQEKLVYACVKSVYPGKLGGVKVA